MESQWENQRPDAGGRPPRSHYRLTAEGARAARLELARGLHSARQDTAGRGAVRARDGRERTDDLDPARAADRGTADPRFLPPASPERRTRRALQGMVSRVARDPGRHERPATGPAGRAGPQVRGRGFQDDPVPAPYRGSTPRARTSGWRDGAIPVRPAATGSRLTIGVIVWLVVVFAFVSLVRAFPQAPGWPIIAWPGAGRRPASMPSAWLTSLAPVRCATCPSGRGR